MKLDISVNVYGAANWKEHWLAYGTVGEKWMIECASCRLRYSGKNPLFIGKRNAVFWLWVFSHVDESCTCPEDDFTDCLQQDLSPYIGSQVDAPTMRDIENSMGPDVCNVSVDIPP